VLEVDRAQVLAFRLSRHHLVHRLPAGSLPEAAAAAGIQETPGRTAAVALHARVAGVTPAGLDRALRQDRSLLAAWAMRGAPYLVPTPDAGVFTTGAQPVGEESLRVFFGGWTASLAPVGVPLGELVTRAAAAAYQVLDGRQLPVDDLRHGIADRLPEIRGLTRPSGAHADLPEPLFRAAGQSGGVCIADTRRMTDALVARTDQWLGRSPPEPDAAAVRAELLRRYLRCYGPSSPQAFAEWTLRGLADVREVVAALGPELVEVRADGSVGMLLGADLEALESPPEPSGARLLPAHDPYLQQRDRERLLPDREQRRRLWRPVGAPGLVLLDGQAAGTWTSRRAGRTLRVTVEPFGLLSGPARRAVAAEADRIAPLRGADRAALEVGG